MCVCVCPKVCGRGVLLCMLLTDTRRWMVADEFREYMRVVLQLSGAVAHCVDVVDIEMSDRCVAVAARRCCNVCMYVLCVYVCMYVCMVSDRCVAVAAR